MPQILTCSGCDEKWTGEARCHCSGCHHTFGGRVSFDGHRDQFGPRGRCKAPESIGLELGDNGVWSYPKKEVEPE